MTGILSPRADYARHYLNFRGVDFSSDHTLVNEQRFAYLVNMYKDYQSSLGQAVETIPGFRRRVVIPTGGKIYGIHSYMTQSGLSQILIHSGSHLYLWHNYPHSIGIDLDATIVLGNEYELIGQVKRYSFTLPKNVHSLSSVSLSSGEDILLNTQFDPSTHTLIIQRSDISPGDTVYYTYKEGELEASDALFSQLAEHKSVSFTFNNRLYLIDGKNYLYFDEGGIHDVCTSAYIPTTYINIIPSGENADTGAELEVRNILSPLFRHTFILSGSIPRVASLSLQVLMMWLLKTVLKVRRRSGLKVLWDRKAIRVCPEGTIS